MSCQKNLRSIGSAVSRFFACKQTDVQARYAYIYKINPLKCQLYIAGKKINFFPQVSKIPRATPALASIILK